VNKFEDLAGREHRTPVRSVQFRKNIEVRRPHEARTTRFALFTCQEAVQRPYRREQVRRPGEARTPYSCKECNDPGTSDLNSGNPDEVFLALATTVHLRVRRPERREQFPAGDITAVFFGILREEIVELREGKKNLKRS
jgi:hypothetical protein